MRKTSKNIILSLENVLGSPHNSAQIPGINEYAARRGARNVAQYLRKEPVDFLVGNDERP